MVKIWVNNFIDEINSISFYQKFKSFILLIFIIATFIPLNLKDILDIDGFEKFNFIFRSPAFFLQLILMALYLRDFKLFSKKEPLGFISYFVLFLFSYSFIVNFLYFQSGFTLILTDYFPKYFFNIMFSVLMINEFKNNIESYYIIIYSIVFGAILFSFLLIIGKFIAINKSSGRFTIIGWKENDLSFLFTMGYALIVSFITDNKFKKMWLNLLIIPISILYIEGVTLTGTRTGLIAISAVLLIIIISFLFNKFNLLNKLALIITNSAYLLIRNSNYEPVSERFFADNFTSVGGRMVHWLYALRISNNNPAFGVGLEKYKELTLQNLSRAIDPENLFFEIYAISGIFCLTFLLIGINLIISKSFIIFLRTKFLKNLILLTPILSSIMVLNIRNYRLFFIFFAIYGINDYIYTKSINLNFRKLFYISRGNI